MRSILFFVALALGTAACAYPPSPSIEAGQQAASEPRIVIGEQSNVCVSVRVDQAVWPIPHLPDADQNFSSFFAGEMERIYRNRGGSYHLPGPEQIPRFVGNPTGSNPRCQERDHDIHITVTYAPREDGRPFVFAYRIEQGTAVRTGSATRDIEEEWRSGRLDRPPLTEPLQIAVTDDMRERARLFIRLLIGD